MAKVFIFFLCLVCFAVYFNSLNNNFVFDDNALIINNPFIKSPKYLKEIFRTSPYDYIATDKDVSEDKMYRPLQIASYSFDYQIWGLKPFGFHLTNVLLHILNCLLLYYLFGKVLSVSAARVASLIFAVHPIHVSVVSYISGRADLLVSLFMLLCITLFFKFMQSRLKIFYIASIFCAALALLSRENALSLFLFILLAISVSKKIDTFGGTQTLPFRAGKECAALSINPEPLDFARGGSRDGEPVEPQTPGFSPGCVEWVDLKSILYVVPFIVLDILYVSLRFMLFGKYGVATHQSLISLPLRIVNFFNILLHYLSVLLLPLDLHMFRTTTLIRRFTDPRIFLIIAIATGIVYLMARPRRSSAFIFCTLWFVIGLLPVFFFFDAYPLLKKAVMAESWLYLSCASFFALFVLVDKASRKLAKVLLPSIVIFYGSLTVINNNYWQGGIRFYENILEYNPQGNPFRKDLINEYLKIGLYDEAYQEIQKLPPDDKGYYIFKGNYYFLKGRIDLAIENYKKSSEKNKKDFYVYYNLSLCYEKLKDLDSAISYAQKSISINPYYVSCLIQLGDLYLLKGEPAQARKYYQMAVDLNPKNAALKERLLHSEQ